MASAHEVVILGANFAGVNLTHHLHRQVFPLLAPLTSKTFHITLISPNSHFYFKIAAPRALINATAIPAEKIFKSISEALQQYGDASTFLQGKATAVDANTRTVTVDTASGEKKVQYDSLFLCTGTTTESPLWTIHDDHEVSVKALKEMHEILPKTKSVLIAGAGPVGVETAGEIAATYPDAKVTLVAGGDVLEKLPAATIAKAKQILQAAKVEVLTNVRVNEATKTEDGTKVDLSNGSSKTVDLYLNARGPSKINSDFLPKSWLDNTGRINTRDAYFRVKGDGAADVAGIYAIGDIVAGSANTAIELDAHVPCAASSFAVDVAARAGKDTSKSGGFLSFIPGFGSKGISQKEFKPMKDTILVPIGPTSGVGQAMGWGLPTFAVKKGKSEKFLMDLVEPAITGTKYAKVA